MINLKNCLKFIFLKNSTRRGLKLVPKSFFKVISWEKFENNKKTIKLESKNSNKNFKFLDNFLLKNFKLIVRIRFFLHPENAYFHREIQNRSFLFLLKKDFAEVNHYNSCIKESYENFYKKNFSVYLLLNYFYKETNFLLKKKLLVSSFFFREKFYSKIRKTISKGNYNLINKTAFLFLSRLSRLLTKKGERAKAFKYLSDVVHCLKPSFKQKNSIVKPRINYFFKIAKSLKSRFTLRKYTRGRRTIYFPGLLPKFKFLKPPTR